MLLKKSTVSLKVYNIKGQLIKTLINSEQEKGKHELTFDLPNVSNGIYLYVIETEDRLETKRMVLQK